MIYRHNASALQHRPVLWLAAALLVVALVAPASALAQSPAKSEYKSTSAQIAAGGGGNHPSGTAGTGAGGNASTGAGGSVGSLPFSGLDLGVLALAAVALLGAGVVLRRLSDPARRSSS